MSHRSHTFAGAVVAAALVLSPCLALAVSVDGKWGLGFEETLTGIPDAADEDSALIAIPASGFAVHKYINHWDFEAVVGARAQIALSGPTRWASFLSLGAHFFAFRAPRANLSVGFRTILGVYRPVDIATQTTGDLRVGLSFEVPLRALFFLSDHFAISGAVGPVAAIETANGNPLTGGKDAVKVNLFKGGFSGGLGFVFFLQ